MAAYRCTLHRSQRGMHRIPLSYNQSPRHPRILHQSTRLTKVLEGRQENSQSHRTNTQCLCTYIGRLYLATRRGETVDAEISLSLVENLKNGFEWDLAMIESEQQGEEGIVLTNHTIQLLRWRKKGGRGKCNPFQWKRYLSVSYVCYHFDRPPLSCCSAVLLSVRPSLSMLRVDEFGIQNVLATFFLWTASVSSYTRPC